MNPVTRTLPDNFNDLVNATLANTELSASHKAYIIGMCFLPVEEMKEVMDQHVALSNRGGEHPAPAVGEFALWEAAE